MPETAVAPQNDLDLKSLAAEVVSRALDAGATDAEVTEAAVANYANPDHPELEDYGHANLVANNGATNYFRVDWLTPTGLRGWGDGRTIILGTTGFIELRKYMDLAREVRSDLVLLANSEGEKEFAVHGKIGFPFFGRF